MSPKITVSTAMPPYYGVVLQNGSVGPDVALLQTWLNGVRSKYPQIPPLAVDGKYGSGTTNAVKVFQTVTGLTIDGKTGNNTWNMAYSEYASLHGEGEVYAGIVSSNGSTGAVVKSMQQRLAKANDLYTGIQKLSVDGKYGSGSSSSMRQFQPQFSLPATGSMDNPTFAKLKAVVNAMLVRNPIHVTTSYPGYVLSVGSSGDPVRFVQSFLSALGGGVPPVTVDGQYGNATKTSVMTFQAKKGLKVDGKVGSATWAALITAFNATL